MDSSEDVMRALSRRFHPSQVKTRKGGGGKELLHIPIETMIGRLNEVLGINWDLELVSSTNQMQPAYEIGEGDNKKIMPTRFHATRDLALTIMLDREDDPSSKWTATRVGTGGCSGHDLDDTSKIAQAEGTKKACNQFGMGSYLWDEDERRVVEYAHKGRIKEAVKLRAELDGIILDGSQVANQEKLGEAYGVDPTTTEGLYQIIIDGKPS